MTVGVNLLALQQSVVQSQNAVSAYFTSEQILPFVFAEQSYYPLSLHTKYMGLHVDNRDGKH